MARPQKAGIDYFPLDVDFFEDDKIALLMGEHGAMGAMVYLRLLCLIYKDNGYFYRWTDSTSALTAKRIGVGCTKDKVELIVRSCVRWSLFDNTLFDMSGVLTSVGIQRRYLSAIRERARKAAAKGRQITVDAQLWLLDEIETSEGLVQAVPAGIVPRINPCSSAEKPQLFHGEIHKEKKRKGEERKAEERESTQRCGMPASPDAAWAARTLRYGNLGIVRMREEEYKALVNRYGKAAVDAKIGHMESWMREKGRTPKDCAAMLNDWLNSDTAAQPAPAFSGKKTGAHCFTQRTYTDEELDALFCSDPEHLNDWK